MMDADELISLILDDDRISKGSLFRDKIYRDEPILQPASRLTGRNAAKPTESNAAPEYVKKLREIQYSSEAVWKTAEWLFYKQGKLAEDCTDSFEPQDIRLFSRPVYSSLSNEELRGFFSWRANLRRGGEAEYITTYTLLYAFELINLIGAESPADAFDKLYGLYERFGGGKKSGLLSELLTDTAVYYRLPPEYAGKLPFFGYDSALTAVLDCRDTCDEALYDALKMLSDYKLDNSGAEKKFPQEYRAVMCAVIRALSEHYENSRDPLFKQLFGLKLSREYIPFRSAVFFRKERQQAYVYDIDPVRRFVCCEGSWQQECYLGSRSKKLGAILRTADSLLRKKLGVKASLKKGDISAEKEQLIIKAINGYFETKQRSSVKKIEIDLSLLGEIRRTADRTRDKLVVEEDELCNELPEESAPETPALPPIEPEENGAETGLPLSDGEAAFLRTLLYGGDIAGAAAGAGSMPSLLADSINDKLFDMFGDTVIGFDGDMPVIIEDYEDELKGKIT